MANGLWNLKDDMASSGHARGPLRMAQSASARGQQRAADAPSWPGSGLLTAVKKGLSERLGSNKDQEDIDEDPVQDNLEGS